ncbi:GAF domain-containing protein [Wenyingzhuangia sp. IMCC45533]
MYILKSPISNKELPIQIHVSFEKIYTYLEEQSLNRDSIFFDSANKILKEMNQHPVLREGFTDFSLLHTYDKQINKLLSILFPDLLQSNEIKAASIPFDMTSFMLSKRFKAIIDNAGEDYVFDIRNFENSNMYIMTCLYILSFLYDYHIDFKRPFFYDIPDLKSGNIKSYRALYNTDFGTIIKTDKAPDITDEDIKILLSNFDNIDIWKEKFPPNSYIFKGFGMINLIDVTQDETISKIKNTFIKRNIDSLEQLESQIRKLFNLKDLKLGISIYNKNKGAHSNFIRHNEEHSLIAKDICNNPETHFCSSIVNRVFNSSLITAIPDLEQYKQQSGDNKFYKTVAQNNLQSIILVPIDLNNDFSAILELGSPRKYELNSINANKLKDIISVLSITVSRAIDERHNLLETVIQENYTTIHPSVKWKFYNAADEYISSHNYNAKLKSISFKNVYPLYGQCDVQGSSVARNTAIQQDLEYQLSKTIDLFKDIYHQEPLPVYKEIIYRLHNRLESIQEGIKTTDELQITDLFKRDIYPVLEHIKENTPSLRSVIIDYNSEIDPNLNIVYKKRKAYEDFITHLNSSLAKHLDKAQKQAQAFYPHYYERFKTDGVDYNMYIGESITNVKSLHPLYIKNLKLWQLQQQCELEYIAKKVDFSFTEISLKVTSLILIHSLPLDIKFRMDEKKFDVDGAYNIRYEIIKKRIDKAYIKGTEERLTQPGKIAIVYTHEHDLEEYIKYINYLTDQDYFTSEIEYVDIEDLQGVSGLKAIRVSINYNRNKEMVSFDHLAEVTKNIGV